MKKLIFLLACALAAAACTSAKTTISGNLAGLPDGTKVTLVMGGTHLNPEPVAEVGATGGKFVFTPELEEPRLFYVRAEGIRSGIAVMAAPGDKVAVTGTFEEPVVTGSKIQEEYDEKFTRPRAEMNKRHTDVNRQFADVSKRMGEARQANDAEAIAEIMAGEEWVAFGRAESDFFRYVGEAVDKVVADNASTFWGPLLLMENTAYLTPDNEKHYNMFSEEARNSFYGKAVAAEIFGTTGKAPAFTAKDSADKAHTLAGLLTGNNYVLVDFWASWCGPCRRFVPTLKGLAEKYADRGLVIVSISTDKDRDAWLKALGEEQMPWLNLLDESNISNDYGVTGIPSVFLIDPKGEIVFGKQNGQSVVDKLAEVFGS